MRLFVITLYYINQKEKFVFGVADSVEMAKEMLDRHYGMYRVMFGERTYPDGAYTEGTLMVTQTFTVIGAFLETHKVMAEITEYHLNKIPL